MNDIAFNLLLSLGTLILILLVVLIFGHEPW
jgi:hypothetical protein